MTEPKARTRKQEVSGYVGPDGQWRPGASTGAGVWDTNKDGLIAWGMGIVADHAHPDNPDARSSLLRKAHVTRQEPSRMGTALHDLMDEALVTGVWPTSFDVELEHPGAGTRWDAALKFVADHQPDPWGTELTVHHQTRPISGTGDFFGVLNGLEGLVVLDWKFSKKTSFTRSVWKHLIQATAIAECTHIETDNGLEPMQRHDWVGAVGFHEDGTYSLFIQPAGDPQLLACYEAGVTAVTLGLDIMTRPLPTPGIPMQPTPTHPQEDRLNTPADQRHIIDLRARLTAMTAEQRDQIRRHHDIGDVEYWEQLTAVRANRLEADIQQIEGWGDDLTAVVDGFPGADVDDIRGQVADILMTLGKTAADIDLFLEEHEPWDADKLAALREQTGIKATPDAHDVATIPAASVGREKEILDTVDQAKALLRQAFDLLDSIPPF